MTWPCELERAYPCARLGENPTTRSNDVTLCAVVSTTAEPIKNGDRMNPKPNGEKRQADARCQSRPGILPPRR